MLKVLILLAVLLMVACSPRPPPPPPPPPSYPTILATDSSITACRFICFSIRKTNYYYYEDQLESSTSPLINNEIQANSSEQETSDTNNSDLEMVCSTLSQEPPTASLVNLPEMKKLPPQVTLSTKIWRVELEVAFKRQRYGTVTETATQFIQKILSPSCVLDSKLDCDRNPFLSFGSKIKKGRGYMFATSVGDQIEIAKLLSSVIQDPNEKTLREAQIGKISTYIENLGLPVLLFIAFVGDRHNGDVNELPELKGKVSVDMLMKIFQKILLKPQGKVSILASALAVVVIAIQHGMMNLTNANDDNEVKGSK
ncbi:hypothetical protein Q3G72_007701 [Acer saccharum]|nr:hypothetical protein Q3G72_007701 [Acer saccharum]